VLDGHERVSRRVDVEGAAEPGSRPAAALRVGGLGDGSGLPEEAVALCRDLGDKRGEGAALTNLGTSRLQAGAPAEAAGRR
jgi:hypothetical protein